MSEKGKGIKGTVAAGGVLVAACAACCAPLIIPPVMALFAAGGIGLALIGQIGIGIAVLGGIVFYMLLRRRTAPEQETKAGCGCGPISACRAGNVSRPL